MKIEGFEDGTVLCDGSICEKWVDMETTCANRPIDSLFVKVMEAYAAKLPGNKKLNHEVHNDN